MHLVRMAVVLALTRCSIKVASFKANWERFFPSLLSLIHTCTCAYTVTKQHKAAHQSSKNIIDQKDKR